MTNLQKLQQIFAKSSLSSEEQDNLFLFFARTSDEDLEPVVTLCEADTGWTEKLYANMKKKTQAVEGKDMHAWQDILEEESENLKELEK